MKKNMRQLQVILVLMLSVSLISLRAMDTQVLIKAGEKAEEVSEGTVADTAEQLASKAPEPVLEAPKPMAVGKELKPKEMREMDLEAEQRRTVMMHRRRVTLAKPTVSQTEKEFSQVQKELEQAQAAKKAADEEFMAAQERIKKAIINRKKKPLEFLNAVDAMNAAEEKAAQTKFAEAQAAKKVADKKLAMASSGEVEAAQQAVRNANKAVVAQARELKRVKGEKLTKANADVFESGRLTRTNKQGQLVREDDEKYAQAVKTQKAVQSEADEADAQVKAAEAAQ